MSYILLNLVFLISFLCISACRKDNSNQLLLNKINDEIKNSFDNSYILVLSEFDCFSCVSKIPEVSANLKNEGNLSIIGLYYHRRINRIFIFDDIVIETSENIDWKRINSETLYIDISELSSNKRGPFLLKIENGSIQSIISISDI